MSQQTTDALSEEFSTLLDAKSVTNISVRERLGSYLQIGSNNDVNVNETQKFIQLLERLHKDIVEEQKFPNLDFDMIINEVDRDSTVDAPLINFAIKHENVAAVKTLVKYNTIINVDPMRREHPMSRILRRQTLTEASVELAKLLLENGAYEDKKYGGRWLCESIRKQNIAMVKLLTDFSKQAEMKESKNIDYYCYDWDSCVNSNQYNIFLTCCQSNAVDCLKYLVSISSNFKTKMDVTKLSEYKENALIIACRKGYVDLFDVLVKDIYKNDKKMILSLLSSEIYNGLYCAMHDDGFGRGKSLNDRVSLVSRLMHLGMNPNEFRVVGSENNKSQEQTSVMYAISCLRGGYHGETKNGEHSVELLKLLFNESNQFEHSFDWFIFVFGIEKTLQNKTKRVCILQPTQQNKLINWRNEHSGHTFMSKLCEYGCLNELKYVLSIANRFDTKLDVAPKLGKHDKNYNPLEYACSKYFSFLKHFNDEFAHFIVSKVYYKGCSKEFDAKSVFDIAMEKSYTGMILALINEYPSQCDIGRAINKFAKQGDFDSIFWMLGDKASNSKEIESVVIKNKIFGDPFEQNENKADEETENVSYLDYLVQRNDLKTFCSFVLKLIKIYHFQDLQSLKKHDVIGKVLIHEKAFLKWFDICEQRSHPVLLSFLTRLNDVAFKNDNFEIFTLLLQKNSLESNELALNNEEVMQLSDLYRKDYKNAVYLYQNLQKSSLKDLSVVINHGLIKHECGFNDTLLFLSKMVDNDAFAQTVENVTDECVTNDKKTVQKHSFFKNNLLNSNIWATRVDKKLLLFDKIKQNVIDKELKTQQMFIQNNVMSEEKTNGKLWKELKSNKLSERISKLKQEAITNKVLYKLNDLPFDNGNGFDGPKEYDHNFYLTGLLISSHQLDPIFQKECKRIFNFKNFGIPCQYAPAPVKTKQRSITKAELDYKTKDWPHTKHIWDFVRCSVVFETVEDMINGCEKFFKEYGRKKSWHEINEKEKDVSCIESIIRIKNGFSSIADESWNCDLSQFDYADIKFNVNIRSSDKKCAIVGEIQFLLKFFLTAKKMGHSVYSFVRKQGLFDQIHRNVENFQVSSVNGKSNQLIKQKINYIILNKNLSQLSFYFENIVPNSNEMKFIISNKDYFNHCLKHAQWKRGVKLFDSFVTTWTN